MMINLEENQQYESDSNQENLDEDMMKFHRNNQKKSDEDRSDSDDYIKINKYVIHII